MNLAKFSLVNILTVLLLHISFHSFSQGFKKPIEFVNPLIGTPAESAGGTIPGVTTPFGMTQWTPMTNRNKIGMMPYIYEGTQIQGFIGTHQPTAWMGDYGYVTIMPGIDQVRVLPEQRQMLFDHNDEVSRPDYYKVSMHNRNSKWIQAEISATERCGIMQFTYPESQNSNLIFEAINSTKFEGWIKIYPEQKEICGYNPDRHSWQLGPDLPNFKGYFVIKFTSNIKKYGVWNGKEIIEAKDEIKGSHIGAYIEFETAIDEQVLVKTGTSFISIEQAKMNLDTEIPHWNFNQIRTELAKKWNEELSKFEIEGGSTDQKIIFYTSLYRTLLYPRIFSEYGKYYSAFDDKIHEGVSYNDFSLWGTFRALHPLLILLHPDRVGEMITALLQMYKEGGWIPMGSNPTYTNIMIGTHSDAVIADAYIKGLRNFDIHLAYKAIRKNAFVPPDSDRNAETWKDCPWEGAKYTIPAQAGNAWWDRMAWQGFEARGGLTYYDSLGYVPIDRTRESVSRTLEFAYNDFCVAQVAKSLNKDDDYQKLMKRALNYKNVFNHQTGFMAPRYADGNWSADTFKLNPAIGSEEYSGFTKGSPWTYLFCVLQDIPGMIELMGGDEKFAAKLDKNFADKHYQHSNEQGHHYIYLYDYCGMPWKTQQLAKKIMRENYFNRPNGIQGNDDCGQMSAWYVFSAIGFYPVTPGTNIYAFGSPVFPKITLKLPGIGKKKLEIIAQDVSNENIYVQKVLLNGEKIEKPFITHEDIMNGGKLIFEMGREPNYNFK